MDTLRRRVLRAHSVTRICLGLSGVGVRIARRRDTGDAVWTFGEGRMIAPPPVRTETNWLTVVDIATAASW